MGHSTRFIEFILEQIDIILAEFISEIRLSGEQTSEYEKRLLSVMEYDIPYTTSRLMKLLGLKSRETMRSLYLSTALKH